MFLLLFGAFRRMIEVDLQGTRYPLLQVFNNKVNAVCWIDVCCGSMYKHAHDGILA
jgi:hypothetical protein